MNGALRRALWVLVIYPPVAWVIVTVVRGIRPSLALPAQLETLVIFTLSGGFVIALLTAWNYPKLGHHGDPPTDRRGDA